MTTRRKKKRPAPVPIDRRLLTAEEVGQRLGMSAWSVYELAKRRQIPHMRIGRRMRFRQADLDQWEYDKVKEAAS